MIIKLLFYLPGILAIIYEYLTIAEPKIIYEFVKKLKVTPGDQRTGNQDWFANLTICYMIWVIMGLFSSQWILFATILALSFVPKKWIVIRWLDALITLLILLFIFVNSFHLHLNLFELIKQSW